MHGNPFSLHGMIVNHFDRSKLSIYFTYSAFACCYLLFFSISFAKKAGEKNTENHLSLESKRNGHICCTGRDPICAKQHRKRPKKKKTLCTRIPPYSWILTAWKHMWVLTCEHRKMQIKWRKFAFLTNLFNRFPSCLSYQMKKSRVFILNSYAVIFKPWLNEQSPDKTQTNLFNWFQWIDLNCKRMVFKSTKYHFYCNLKWIDLFVIVTNYADLMKTLHSFLMKLSSNTETEGERERVGERKCMCVCVCIGTCSSRSIERKSFVVEHDWWFTNNRERASCCNSVIWKIWNTSLYNIQSNRREYYDS